MVVNSSTQLLAFFCGDHGWPAWSPVQRCPLPAQFVPVRLQERPPCCLHSASFKQILSSLPFHWDGLFPVAHVRPCSTHITCDTLSAALMQRHDAATMWQSACNQVDNCSNRSREYCKREPQKCLLLEGPHCQCRHANTAVQMHTAGMSRTQLLPREKS